MGCRQSLPVHSQGTWRVGFDGLETMEGRIRTALQEIIVWKMDHPQDSSASFNRVILKFPVIRQAFSSIKEVFKRFDVDKNGTIDSSELGNAMRALGAQLTPAAVDQMFGYADISEKGTLSFKEFLICLCIGSVLQLFPLLKAYSQVDLKWFMKGGAVSESGEPGSSPASACSESSGGSGLMGSRTETSDSEASDNTHSKTSTGGESTGASAVIQPMDPSFQGSALYESGRRLIRALRLVLEAYVLFDADASGTIDRDEVFAIIEEENRKAVMGTRDGQAVHSHGSVTVKVGKIDGAQSAAAGSATPASATAASEVAATAGSSSSNEAAVRIPSENQSIGSGLKSMIQSLTIDGFSAPLRSGSFKEGGSVVTQPRPARRRGNAGASGNALLSRERWMELDWDGDGQTTFREFLMAFMTWIGVDDDDSDDDEEYRVVASKLSRVSQADTLAAPSAAGEKEGASPASSSDQSLPEMSLTRQVSTEKSNVAEPTHFSEIQHPVENQSSRDSDDAVQQLNHGTSASESVVHEPTTTSTPPDDVTRRSSTSIALGIEKAAASIRSLLRTGTSSRLSAQQPATSPTRERMSREKSNSKIPVIAGAHFHSDGTPMSILKKKSTRTGLSQHSHGPNDALPRTVEPLFPGASQSAMPVAPRSHLDSSANLASTHDASLSEQSSHLQQVEGDESMRRDSVTSINMDNATAQQGSFFQLASALENVQDRGSGEPSIGDLSECGPTNDSAERLGRFDESDSAVTGNSEPPAVEAVPCASTLCEQQLEALVVAHACAQDEHWHSAAARQESNLPVPMKGTAETVQPMPAAVVEPVEVQTLPEMTLTTEPDAPSTTMTAGTRDGLSSAIELKQSCSVSVVGTNDLPPSSSIVDRQIEKSSDSQALGLAPSSTERMP